MAHPRMALNGEELPLARMLSLALHTERNVEDIRRTHMLAVFGQFLDHDIAGAPDAGGTERTLGNQWFCIAL